MFAAFVNPTPLLDIAAQELAFRAKGVVIVYIEAERDTYALRNVLKVCRGGWGMGGGGGGRKEREKESNFLTLNQSRILYECETK